MEKIHSKFVEEYNRTLAEVDIQSFEQPKSPVSIRVPPRYVFIADHFAARIGETRSGFMESLICQALDELMDYFDNWKELNEKYDASKKTDPKEVA